MEAKRWRLGIIGWPLGYSLSPLMHTAVLKAAGLEGEYKEYPVRPEEVDRWLQEEALKLDGFNVTMPHKEAVCRWIHSNPDRASFGTPPVEEGIGAVNTVKMEPGRLIGFNTDRQGFFGPLRERRGPDCLEGKRVLLLGAGGAARAVAVSLHSYGAASVVVWNRDPDRAERMVQELGSRWENAGWSRCELSWRESLKDVLSNVDLLVNATPVGMKNDDPVLVDADSLEGRHWVYDMVYQPRETKLIQAARRHRCQCVVTGDEMLAHQGAESLEIWTGADAVRGEWYVDIMRRALDEHFRSR